MLADHNPRVMILINEVEKNFTRIANSLGWTVTTISTNNAHSYAVFSVDRDSSTHKFCYLYSQSTDKSVYRLLESTGEVIFIHGTGVDPQNSFSQGCAIPVLPDGDFLHVMTDWNMEHLGAAPSQEERSKKKEDIIHIIEETPLQQIYDHLRSLTSRTVATQAVLYHTGLDGSALTEDVVRAKAEGISYLVQNAIDYYDTATTGNMTQRLLNLYYGTIAFMEAEMLVRGTRYSQLSEIENVTKSGHGMITFGNAESLKNFYIGVLDKGLFQAWLSHRGVEVSDFADSRRKAQRSDLAISLDELFRHIPELQNVMQEMEPDYKPYFLFPSYDMLFNHTYGSGKPIYERKYIGSYVDFIGLNDQSDLDWDKQLIESFLAPLTIIGKYKDTATDTIGWRTFVTHRKDGHHYESYHTHKGLSASMVIAPLFGRTDDWEAFAVMILYALSIIVRYMPNLWARISHGDLDYYKAVFYQFSRVAERELTQIFLERLTGKRVMISHPQGMI